jgi:hypothetical protein
MEIAVNNKKRRGISATSLLGTILKRIKRSVFWEKGSRWEFWPFSLFYFPIFFYGVWLTIKTRSFFFFSASNPSIEFGGMLGESKAKIFDLIPKQYLPKTYLLEPNIDLNEFLIRLKEERIIYPFILKPDIGERGWMVELVKSEAALESYLGRIEVDFLVQEYVNYPIELGVFYYRYPNLNHGTISSVVVKEMLSVTGDGRSSVEQLMLNSSRASSHIEQSRIKNPALMDTIPVRHEKIELNGIGNHSLGTTFLDGNHLISRALISAFDKVSLQIDGFYFGRFDIRCNSVEELSRGLNFKILELNGAGSEPAHIYQPDYPLLQAYRDIIHHLGALAEISSMNKQRGESYMGFIDGIKEVLKIRKYNRNKRT